MTLQKNDRINIYEVLTDGGYPDGIMTPGTFRPGSKFTTKAHEIMGNNSDMYPMETDMAGNPEVRLVGVMVVKEVRG